MTPDEIAKLIPDEVVEAAARAAHDQWRHECAVKSEEDVSYWLEWEALEDEADREGWREQARAAIAAALSAWKGAVDHPATVASPRCLWLPLAQETDNG